MQGTFRFAIEVYINWICALEIGILCRLIARKITLISLRPEKNKHQNFNPISNYFFVNNNSVFTVLSTMS